jgi:glycosyltransferase involved in cell wall biosynthesis
MPRISVVIPSYNHEKYLRECLQSVLIQTFPDFEIIITDDGSSDRSVDVIKEFKDQRIHLYIHSTNKGACIALNNCIRNSSGEYIAVLNSDDAWEPAKLEKQMDFLDNHPEIAAVFSKATFINESSLPITKRNFNYFQVLEKENRTRFAWLHFFFFEGNCLCHPGVLIRKSCYDDVGVYDARIANLPDLDMWVRLCLKYEIHVMDDKLVRFRIRDKEINASGDNPTNRIRRQFESIQIFNHFLTIQDSDSFLKIFPEAVKYGEIHHEYIPYLLGRLALEVNCDAAHLWGLEVLNKLIGDCEKAVGIESRYNFHYRDFINLTAQYDVFKVGFRTVSLPFSRKTGIFFHLEEIGWMTKIILGLINLLRNVRSRFRQ